MNNKKPSLLFTRVLSLTILLALVVIVLGAYTRLSDAGLGCPDWPGCYGKMLVPDVVESDQFNRPLEHAKAWKEMIHRYVAGLLGLLILAILFMVIKGLPQKKQTIKVPLILLGVVTFQALLGMWTVTMLLSPIIVSAHLMGGMATLSLIWWLYLNQKQRPTFNGAVSSRFKSLAVIGLIIVVIQIFLGGWTSSNYAALACGVDFPTCAGQWWPKMNFASGFDISHTSGINYEFGILDSPARTAIQFVHRVGALIVFVYLISFSVYLMKKGLKVLAGILTLILLLQVSLGILNVVLALPLFIAVLHNLVAALLLLTVVSINHLVFKHRY